MQNVGMKFEVGKSYECVDLSFDPLKIVSRTEKFVTVCNGSNTWRTKIRKDDFGNEYVVDTSMPKSCWECTFKWSSIWEVE